MSRRSTTALLAAAACAAFAVLVWVAAYRTGFGRAADAAAMHGFMHLQVTGAAPLAPLLAYLCNPEPFAVLAAVVLLHGWYARGPRGAAAVAVILAGANVVTQQLKPALAEARPLLPAGGYVDAVSWPSGHSTAAMALALAAVVVAPPPARRLVAVAGGLFAAGVAYSVVLLGWHFPSDALGGFAVAGATAGVAVAALRAAEERRPARAVAYRALERGRRLAVPAAAVALVLIASVLLRVAIWLPGAAHAAAFLAGGVAIVGLGLILAGAGARA